MITIKDCEAFCEADTNWVNELACRECLTMVHAYARAHEMTVCANDVGMAMATRRAPAPTEHRFAA
jgi:hypothetical protein